MKNIQVSAIFMLLVLLLFAASKEVMAQMIPPETSCTSNIILAGCKKDVCTNSCQQAFGIQAKGDCFGDGCLCTHPCPYKSCAPIIKLAGCKNNVCLKSCQETCGDKAKGACFAQGCLCTHPA